MKYELRLHDEVGSFAGNGTLANQIRIDKVEPHWEQSERITLNFEGVNSMTDSFVNAFVGNIAEAHPDDFREKLRFTNCSSLVKTFIKSALQMAQNRISH
ncbi:MAG: hypothetical protein ACI9SQ_000252 [Rubritalea sp.]|jgi:hypothetical protein